MGDFLNKLKKNIDKSMTTVSVKSNTAIEINKIKSQIKVIKSDIEQKKSKLGDTLYKMYLEDTYHYTVQSDICEAIKKAEEDLRTKELEIEQIKKEEERLLAEKNVESEVVPNTEVDMTESSQEVNQVGETEEQVASENVEQPTEKVDDVLVEEENKLCQCGVQITEDMNFCISCGRKLKG